MGTKVCQFFSPETKQKILDYRRAFFQTHDTCQQDKPLPPSPSGYSTNYDPILCKQHLDFHNKFRNLDEFIRVVTISARTQPLALFYFESNQSKLWKFVLHADNTLYIALDFDAKYKPEVCLKNIYPNIIHASERDMIHRFCLTANRKKNCCSFKRFFQRCIRKYS